LYDVRNFSGGAFSEMKVQAADVQQAMETQRVTVPQNQALTWKSIDFNLSGNRMLVEADPGITLVLDGYEGTVQRIFQSKTGSATSACFTPDDQSVLVANDAGTVDCWNLQSGTIVKTLEGHLGPVGALKCNPKYSQIASSCTNTCLWIW
jgi:WD40 repeat protein